MMCYWDMAIWRFSQNGHWPPSWIWSDRKWRRSIHRPRHRTSMWFYILSNAAMQCIGQTTMQICDKMRRNQPAERFQCGRVSAKLSSLTRDLHHLCCLMMIMMTTMMVLKQLDVVTIMQMSHQQAAKAHYYTVINQTNQLIIITSFNSGNWAHRTEKET